MITGQDILVVREQRRDALAYAERERLVRQVLQRNPPSVKRHQLWLVRLGEHMVSWGQRLQTRYASA